MRTPARSEIRLNGSKAGLRLDLARSELWLTKAGEAEQPVVIPAEQRRGWRVEADFIDSIRERQGMAYYVSSSFDANVIEGPYMEALRYALPANANHGVRRSNADKRKCIAQALKQWPEVANMQIARLADVDDKTVASVRSEMEESGKLKASFSSDTVE